MLLEGIIITCSAAMEGHRSTSAIYNIIVGKKSIQTVQDVHVYYMNRLYGIYRDLTKSSFDEQIVSLINQRWLRRLDDGVCIPTLSGLNWYRQTPLNLQQFNGMRYNSVEPIFIDRLFLFIQTLTNAAQNCFTFIPVVDDAAVSKWIKQVYRRIHSPQSVLRSLHQELSLLLQDIPDEEVGLFVDRLTGYKHYGKSVQQLADTYQLSQHNVRLSLKKTHHYLIDSLIKNSAYPILGYLLTDIQQPELMTNSAMETYSLLKQGHSPDAIAVIRKLKVNTIQDHVVEIIYFDSDLSLEPYVLYSDQKNIVQAIQQTHSQRLKDIKLHLDEHISYFQIRLVMAVLKRTGDTNNALTSGR